MAWVPSYAGQSPDFDRCVALAQEGDDDHLQNIFWSINPEHDVHFDMDESNSKYMPMKFVASRFTFKQTTLT